MTQRAYDGTRWRRQQIVLCGRFGKAGEFVCVPSKQKLATIGVLTVHTATPEVHRPREEPTSWYLTFPRPPGVPATWVITHATTGLRLSRGKDKRGYRKKTRARLVAELISHHFGEMLSNLPTARGHKHVVAALKDHPRWDDLAAYIKHMEELHTHGNDQDPWTALTPTAT